MHFNHILTWLNQMGVSDFCTETPACFLKKKETVFSQTENQNPTASLLLWAKEQAQKASSLSEIYQILSSFTSHPLHKTALHTLAGTGVETPLVLCILDTPTADADKTNLLTAGKSGELFEKMIKAIDLFLTQNCFVLPSIPWRPPGNRQPTPDEINLCLPFLKKQIQLINPKSILLMGSLSPQILLQNSLPKSRQQQFNLTIQQNTYPCFATFSSTMVLEQSSLREKAWEDLKKFRSFLQTLS